MEGSQIDYYFRQRYALLQSPFYFSRPYVRNLRSIWYIKNKINKVGCEKAVLFFNLFSRDKILFVCWNQFLFL